MLREPSVIILAVTSIVHEVADRSCFIRHFRFQAVRCIRDTGGTITHNILSDISMKRSAGDDKVFIPLFKRAWVEFRVPARAAMC